MTDNEQHYEDIPAEGQTADPASIGNQGDKPEFITIYEEENSQSTRNTRPLCRARIDENDTMSLVMMMRLIELQRAALEESIMEMKIGAYTFHVSFKIIQSKVDKERVNFKFFKSNVLHHNLVHGQGHLIHYIVTVEINDSSVSVVQAR